MFRKLFLLFLPLSLCTMDEFDGEWSDSGMALQPYSEVGDLPGYDFGMPLPARQDQDSQGLGDSTMPALSVGHLVTLAGIKRKKVDEANAVEPNHSAAQYRCDICDKSFDFHSQLDQHNINKHGTEGKYKCMPCDKSFRYSGELDQHNINKHGAESKHKCILCNKPFSCASKLQRHRCLLRLNYHQDEGGVSSVDAGELEALVNSDKRKKLKRKLAEKVASKASGSYRYSCQTCSKGFKLPTEYKEHMRGNEDCFKLAKENFLKEHIRCACGKYVNMDCYLFHSLECTVAAARDAGVSGGFKRSEKLSLDLDQSKNTDEPLAPLDIGYCSSGLEDEAT